MRKIEKEISQDESFLYFLRKIFDYDEIYSDFSYSWEDIFQYIENYEKWLRKLEKDFSIKKKYDINHIAEQIFSNKITKQTSKYHIVAIQKSIEILKKELKLAYENEYPPTMDYIKGKLALMYDIVLDAYEFIRWQCEKRLIRRRLFSSNEIFHCSKQILRRYFYYNDITFSSISIFLIRQAIETKILNSLGILKIVDPDGTLAKFKLEKLVEFIDKNEDIEFPIPKSILLKITKWTNIYIHRGVMLYHWQIVLAHEVLQPLFSAGVGETEISLYGSVKIKKDYYNQKLERDLLEYLNLTNCKIVKLKNPEAIIE